MSYTASKGIKDIAKLQAKGEVFLDKLSSNKILLLCNVDPNKMQEEYDFKIRNSNYLMRKFYEFRKKRDLKTYKKVMEEVKNSLEESGEERDSLLRYLNVVKKTKPEKIPKELSDLI